MDQVDSAVALFQGLLSLGGLVAVIWAAGFLVFNTKQLRKDFETHKSECHEHDNHSRILLAEEKIRALEKDIESIFKRVNK